MTGNINCPSEHGEMALVLAEKEAIFRGEKITYQVESYVCGECGLNIGTIEQTAAAQNAIARTFPTERMVFDAAHREDVWKSKDPGETIPYSDADQLTEI